MYGGLADDDGDYEEDDFIFNEYTIDDTLDSLSRLEKYYNSEFSLQRLVLVRELFDTAVEAGYQESFQRIMPLLVNFVQDNEPAVKQVFAEQLPALAKFFVENNGEEAYNELSQTFIPYTFELIIDKNAEVCQAATASLIKISELIKPEHIQSQLLSVVVTLAQNNRVEDYRIIAAQLFNELAGVFGDKLCKEVCLNEIIGLSDDASFSVRKTVAQNLGNICKVIGPEATEEKLLPIFVELSKDEIWGVRKACAESLISISESVSHQIRQTQLVDIFERFIEDVSRWVRIEAKKQLGAFIYTFHDGEVPEKLVKYFTDMAFHGENSNESDMAEYCAYNFPAVTLALGKEKWPLLEPAYSNLVKDVQWKVRRSLSCSLHEIAKILGTEITEASLTNAIEIFLGDLDEVKIGVVTNFAKLMEVLTEESRNKYLPVLCSLPNESENWRIRGEVARQLGEFSRLVSPAQVHNVITTLLTKFVDDVVAEVRFIALDTCGAILKRLCEGDEEGKQQFIQFLRGLATHQSCLKRQLFAHLCGNLSREIDAGLFEAEFIPLLLTLANDAVPNVRLAMGRLVRNYLLESDTWKEHEKVQELLNILKEDQDRDVKYFSTVSTASAEQPPQTAEPAPQQQQQQPEASTSASADSALPANTSDAQMESSEAAAPTPASDASAPTESTEDTQPSPAEDKSETVAA